jgi:two-component system, sensor histidine kinase YesM
MILLLFSSASLIVLGFVLYWRSSGILINQEQEHNRLELSQLASNLESFIDRMDVISKDFDTTVIVQTVLNRVDSGFSPDVGEQRELGRFIGKTVVTHSGWLASINLFDVDGSRYYSGLGGAGMDAEALEAFKSSAFYSKMEEGQGRLVIGPLDAKGEYVLAGRIVNSTSDFKPVGVLVMHVRLSEVTAYFSKTGLIGSSKYILYNPYGDAIGAAPRNKREDDLLLSAGDGDEIVLEGINYLVSSEEIRAADWRLLKLTRIESIIQSTEVLKQTLWVYGLVTSAAIVALAIMISNWVSRPLNNLKKLMNKSIEDRFLVKAPMAQLDEVGQLIHSYNLMMQEIKELINKEYKLKYLNKEMELRSLQAQINPHFIYNTLDTINWAARLYGHDDIGRMAVSLANLLRISIRDQDKPYLIRDEVEYISNYMAIQQYRFEDRVKLELHVQDELYDIPIPRLIIQPLLENAIVHNVDRNENSTVIVISMRSDEKKEYAVITVSDNGIGIPDSVVESIFSPEGERDSAFPRGLANVHRRLILNYGDGLDIQTSLQGTTFRFRIPLGREGESHGL